MNCTCKDWIENIDKIDGPIKLQAGRSGFAPGCDYTGKPFVYCPWCAKKLEEQSRTDPNKHLCSPK